jgi:hypothetical protein
MERGYLQFLTRIEAMNLFWEGRRVAVQLATRWPPESNRKLDRSIRSLPALRGEVHGERGCTPASGNRRGRAVPTPEPFLKRLEFRLQPVRVLFRLKAGLQTKWYVWGGA